MRPRRKVFGEAFILETVHCFNLGKGDKAFSTEELKWAGDVLDEYFSVVADSPVIRKARQYYSNDTERQQSALPGNNIESSESSKPYPMAALPEASLSFEQLYTLFLRRRSVRWYKQLPVPDHLIQTSINAAALAPSACNRQPFRFIVSNEPYTAAKIAECAGGTSGFSHQLPAIIVVVGDLSAYPEERDRHLIYIDSSLASMQLMLAAETLGLSTCPINWPDVDRAEKRLKKLLKLAPFERVIMLIAIGYGDPEGGIPYSQKKKDAWIISKFSLNDNRNSESRVP